MPDLSLPAKGWKRMLPPHHMEDSNHISLKAIKNSHSEDQGRGRLWAGSGAEPWVRRSLFGGGIFFD